MISFSILHYGAASPARADGLEGLTVAGTRGNFHTIESRFLLVEPVQSN